MKTPKPNAQDATRRKAALRRLGVAPDQLRRIPNISDTLKVAKGGLKDTLAAMRYSSSLAVVAFLEKYDSIPERDRKSLSWEAIAIAADVNLDQLMGGIVFALQNHSAMLVKIMALSHHPEIIQKQIEFAKERGGEKDRSSINTALGFLPTPKGSTFIINPSKPVSSMDDEDGEDTSPEVPEDDLEHLFPSLSKTQETLVPIQVRQLEATT